MEGINYLEDIGIDGRITLKQILRKGDMRVCKTIIRPRTLFTVMILGRQNRLQYSLTNQLLTFQQSLFSQSIRESRGGGFLSQGAEINLDTIRGQAINHGSYCVFEPETISNYRMLALVT
jgi:hypothetical protein